MVLVPLSTPAHLAKRRRINKHLLAARSMPASPRSPHLRLKAVSAFSEELTRQESRAGSLLGTASGEWDSLTELLPSGDDQELNRQSIEDWNSSWIERQSDNTIGGASDATDLNELEEAQMSVPLACPSRENANRHRGHRFRRIRWILFGALAGAAACAWSQLMAGDFWGNLNQDGFKAKSRNSNNLR